MSAATCRTVAGQSSTKAPATKTEVRAAARKVARVLIPISSVSLSGCKFSIRFLVKTRSLQAARSRPEKVYGRGGPLVALTGGATRDPARAGRPEKIMKKRLLDWIVCPECGKRPELRVFREEKVEIPTAVASPACSFWCGRDKVAAPPRPAPAHGAAAGH